jgi:hypothetical protein
MRSKITLVRKGVILLIGMLAIFAVLALIRHANNELISTNTSIHAKEVSGKAPVKQAVPETKEV